MSQNSLISPFLSKFETFKQYADTILFDYDRTIATIPVSWENARVEGRIFFNKTFPSVNLPQEIRVDEMEALIMQAHPDRADEIFFFRKQIEEKALSKHIPVQHIAEVLQSDILTGKYRLFIVSNNLYETIHSGLKELGLENKFEAILGVDTVGLPKPYIRAADILQNTYNVDLKQTVMLGDSDSTDGVFCQRIGIPFLNIQSFI